MATISIATTQSLTPHKPGRSYTIAQATLAVEMHAAGESLSSIRKRIGAPTNKAVSDLILRQKKQRAKFSPANLVEQA